MGHVTSSGTETPRQTAVSGRPRFRRLGVGVLSLVAAACSAAGPAPSPTPAVTTSPWAAKCQATPRQTANSPAAELTIVAEVGAAGCGFDTVALAAPAAPKITIEFIDRDSVLPHNFAVYKRPDREGLVAGTAYLLAPQRETIELVGLQPGTYYFLCDSHTSTMFGTLMVGSAPG